MYDIWSRYEPEATGVSIAYASIHGNTAKAAEYLAAVLKEQGEEKVVLMDLARADMAEAIEDAFKYDCLVLAAASYDGGVFPCMHMFLHHLERKLYQKRSVGIIENGTWSPSAKRMIKSMLDCMKDIQILEPSVTIYSTMKEEQKLEIRRLAENIVRREKPCTNA